MRWQNTLFPWLEALGFEAGKNEKSIFYLSDRDLTILTVTSICIQRQIKDALEAQAEKFREEAEKAIQTNKRANG